MPQFVSISVDSKGERIETRHDAVSVPEVSSFLRSKGLTPISIREVKGEAFGGQAVKELSSIFAARRIKQQEIADFFRQLATMLEAGVSLSESLDSLSLQISNVTFARIVRQIREYVSWGRSFYEALSEFPRIFPPLVREMIAVGEETGSLERVTGEVADYLEAQIELKKKIQNAVRYPVFIAGFFLVAAAVMVFYVIPQFKQIFDTWNAQLPGITLFLLGLSDFFVSNVIWEVIIIAGAAIFLFGYLRTKKGKGTLDKIILKVPIVAKLAYFVILARICRTLALLLHSGVPLVVALDHTAATTDNVVAEGAIRRIREKIVQGSTLTEEMDREEFFPSMVVGMVRTGEQSGTLSEVLPKVANFYDREVDHRIQALTQILEPVLIIIVGAMVAFFALAMYYPIFKMGEALGA